MGVENFLDAGTNHITCEDSMKLLEEPDEFPSRVITHEFGWWIFVPLDHQSHRYLSSKMRKNGYSEAFIRLVRRAYIRHCWWINLDFDGGNVDNLEYFEWQTTRNELPNKTIIKMGEQTNQFRGTRAKRLLEIYHSLTNDTIGLDDDIVTDVLADLMHYCNTNNVDIEVSIKKARYHFEEELQDENGIP